MSSATATKLWRMSATELAEAIRTRQASSVEVIEAHLRRIETVNSSTNAVVVVLGEQALHAAKAADRAVAAGDDVPPFHGVPFTIKDIIDVAGTPTTQGFKALAQAYPTMDAPIVERMKAAGAIPIGRTNVPSGAIRWHCDSELWGATVNPWDRTRTPGASSAGEAAAIATGMSPLGLGSDGLGSLRHPAQCCGIAALKPTLGRVPQASSIEPEYATIGMQLTAVAGPLARRVADLRAAFGVLAGPTWRDPWTVAAPLYGPQLPKPVRVALVVDPPGGARPTRCRRASARRPRHWRTRATTSTRSSHRRLRRPLARCWSCSPLQAPARGGRSSCHPWHRPIRDGSWRRSSTRPVIQTT
jgi:amidase